MSAPGRTAGGPAPEAAPLPFSSRPRGTIETLSRLTTFLSPYKGRIIANIGSAILSLSSALTFPQLTQYLVDGVLTRRDSASLPLAVLGLLFAFLLRDVFSAIHTLVSNSFEQQVIFRLRQDVYRHLQQLPVPYFDSMSSGDLSTRVLDDVTDVARLLVDGTEQSVISLATIGFILVILFLKDPSLAAFSIIPLPFVIASSAWFTVAAHGRLRVKRRSLSILNAELLDSLQGIRQIKAFGQGEQDIRRIETRSEEFRRSTINVLNLWAVYVPTMAFLTSLGTVLVWGFGGQAVINQTLTLGELISFVFYLSMLYTPVINIHGLNSLLQSARTAGERLFDILDQPLEQAGWPGTGELATPANGDVRYDAISFGYRPDRPVLRDISFHARPAQTIALVGATGAGKSTIVNLLLGFYRPDAGRILIDGRDIQELTLPCLRRQISLVTQQQFLFSGTIRDNIVYGRPGAPDDDVIAAAQAAHCHGFISAMPDGYNTPVGEHGVRLSGGERQRISIARALLKNAPILILDEATASVDSQTERLVQDALSRLRAQRTTIIIAHRISTVRRADQILVLDGGTIAEMGNHEHLVRANGFYARLYEEQAQL